MKNVKTFFTSMARTSRYRDGDKNETVSYRKQIARRRSWSTAQNFWRTQFASKLFRDRSRKLKVWKFIIQTFDLLDIWQRYVYDRSDRCQKRRDSDLMFRIFALVLGYQSLQISIKKIRLISYKMLHNINTWTVVSERLTLRSYTIWIPLVGS